MSATDVFATWQAEFDQIRQRDGLRLGGLINPRLRVLPSWAGFMHRSFGAAFVCLSRVYVDRRVLAAPAEVRSYLLLHEWGHVVHRHTRWSIVAAVLIGNMLFSECYAHTHNAHDWMTAPIAILGLACACALFILGMWMLSVTREFEADAYAASVIGPAATINGMAWVARWSGQGWTPSRKRRRAALWRQMQ